MPRKKKRAEGIPIVATASRVQSGARPHSSNRQNPIAVVVSVRRQTSDEERRYRAALQLFLTEIVRQHLGRNGDRHERK